MVPGVPFSFSFGGSLTLFIPLMNQSQPTIKLGSLCSRFQNTCGTAHNCVIFVLQNELVIPLVSLVYCPKLLSEYNCVEMCSLFHLCLPQTGAT